MITRREYLAASSAVLLSTAGLANEAAQAADTFDPASPLPHKDAFSPPRGAYLNCVGPAHHPGQEGQ